VASKHLLRLPAARPFAFAVCGSDFKGSSRLESIFRALSSPPDLEIRLAQGGKRRGTEEVQRARIGRADGSLLCRSGLFTLTKEGQPSHKNSPTTSCLFALPFQSEISASDRKSNPSHPFAKTTKRWGTRKI